MIELISDTLADSDETVTATSQRIKHNNIKQQANEVRFVVFDDDEKAIDNEIRLTYILNFSAEHLAKLQEKAKRDPMVITRQENDLENNQRGEKIYNEGVRYGAQAGLKSTLDTFRSATSQMEHALSTVYDFNTVLLGEGQIVPPIIGMSKNVTEVNADATRLSNINTRYTIRSQAKIRTSPLTFHEYMQMPEQEVMPPSIFSIPLNDVELTYWAAGVYAGWARGKRLAEQEISNAILKLKLDWIGMKRYEVLVKQNIIRAPIIKSAENHLEGDSKSLNVGLRALEMTKLPEWEFNSDLWEVLPMLDQLEIKLIQEHD